MAIHTTDVATRATTGGNLERADRAGAAALGWRALTRVAMAEPLSLGIPCPDRVRVLQSTLSGARHFSADLP